MKENDTSRYSHTSSLERFNPDVERQALGIEVKESTRGRKITSRVDKRLD